MTNPSVGEIREFAVPAPESSPMRLLFQKKIFDGEDWHVLFDWEGQVTSEVKDRVEKIVNRIDQEKLNAETTKKGRKESKV